MVDQTDEALMAAFRNGDASAFSTLVARHEKPLWNFLRRFVRDDAAAEDLMQEAMLRVLRANTEWQPTAKFSTWLYTIARNLCVDHARRMVHRNASSLDAAPSGAGDGSRRVDGRGDGGTGPSRLDRLAGTDRGGEAEALSRETAARIEAAIGELPDEQREVFLMREVMDLPFAEIALAVGVTLPTVKSRMRYALVRLRQALQDLREPAAAESAGTSTDPRPIELP